MFFYKSYPFAPKASVLSAVSAFGTYLCVIGAICMVALGVQRSFLWILAAVALLAAAAALYLLVYRKIVPEKAKAETETNVKTKGSFAAMYCNQHPEAYDELMRVNPDFAAKYTRNEKGRVVKQK